MGDLRPCTVFYDCKVSSGNALLETKEIVFRGDFRLVIPLSARPSVKAGNGELRIKFNNKVARFQLGEQAEKWEYKILHPKTLMEKLGVKAGAVVSVIDVNDPDFARQLISSGASISTRDQEPLSNLIFLGAEKRSDLRPLMQMKRFLAASGSLWVVYPKGQSGITEAQVISEGRNAGLVDVKVVAFSPTHTALKFSRRKSR